MKRNCRDLEPAFFVGDVGCDKFFIRLGQVDDPFNQTEQCTQATSDIQKNLENSLFCVTENEFVNSQTAK